MAERLAVVFVLCGLFSLVPGVHAETGSSLALVYVINRHGARNLLPKTSTLQDAAVKLQGDVTLLPSGQRQCQNAGLAFFGRYLNASSCASAGATAGQPSSTCLAPAGSSAALSGFGSNYGVVTDPGITWSNYDVLVTSSALDRTLLSARGFVTGAFPNKNAVTSTAYMSPDGEQPVPIYSSAALDGDDSLIRAYANCPTMNSRLTAWYLTSPFLAMSAATASFRAYVGALPGWGAGVVNDVSLVNWYNVWDEFNTFISSNGAYGDPMPLANALPAFASVGVSIPGTAFTSLPGATLFAQITWLAYWLETSKMASGLTGALLGGPLLNDLNNRLATAVRLGAAAPTFPRLVIMSGHYNSQLGVLAALGLDTSLTAAQVTTIPWLTVPNIAVGVIPAAAAVLAFELHQSGVTNTSFAVRAVLQNGPSAAYTTVPLPCASAAGVALGGTGACTLADFQALLAPPIAAAGSTLAWCVACRNVVAMPCRAAFYTSGAVGGARGVGTGLMTALALAVLAAS